MPINVTTVYTKERLLKFNNFIVLSKYMRWGTMLIGTLVMLSALIFGIINQGEYVPTVRMFTVLIAVLDALFVAYYLIIPIFAVKKAKNLNTSVKYTFYDSCFEIDAKTSYTSEPSRLSYSYIIRAARRKNTVYLLFSPNQGYIIDISKISEESKKALYDILYKNLGKSKLKW